MSTNKKSIEKKWFLPNPDGINEPLGPFTTAEIKARLDNETLALDSYVWNDSLGERKWHRIFQLNDFVESMPVYPKAPLPKKRSAGQSAQVVKVDFNHSKEKGEYGIENEYRRFPRAPMKAKAIVHNQVTYCEVDCVDISEKGIFVAMNDPSIFQKGEEVTITIIDNNFFQTISIPSVVMKILNKEKIKGQGLYFLRLNPQIRRKIAEYVVKTLGQHTEEQTA